MESGQVRVRHGDEAPVAPTAFGAWLRQQRERAGLTQEELAERAGMTASAVAALERGRRRRPYPHTVRALLAALGVQDHERAAVLDLVTATGSRVAGAPPVLPPDPPSAPRPLIGRDAALGELQAWLAGPERRLVTLTGPGGVGKTSLALEAARRSAASFADGVAVVSLEMVDDPALVVPSIAARLGLTGLARHAEAAALRAHLHGRRLLLVLDNLEHLLAAAGEIGGLLAAHPGLKVLATSRAPLRLRDEWEYPVGPLGVPGLATVPTPDEIVTADAVRLFVERARASFPSFAVTQANATAIAAICRRLDGLPLALELAAARLRVLSPTELLARLDQALPVLAGGARDLPERQRTIRQAIAWSYRILGPDEQALFRRLSIFVGGWDAGAAEAMGSGLANADPLDVLSGLAEHSLVVAEPEDGRTRYRMLETIRQFGRDELGARGELDDAARAHAEWCLAWAEQAATHYYGPDEDAWLDRLEREHPNLRAALAYAVTAGDEALLVRLVAAVGRLWLKREHAGDGVDWVGTTLAIARRSGPTPAGATALFTIGRMAWDQGDTATGMALLRESLDAWNALGNEPGACSAGVTLANMLRLSGEADEAESLLQSALVELERPGSVPYWHSLALRLLGIIALEREDWREAEAYLDHALAAGRAGRSPWSTASALHNLAHLHHLRRDHARALGLYGESLRISLEQRDLWSIAVTFPPVAEVLVALGEHGHAAELFGAGSSLGEVMAARLATRIPVVESQERARAVARQVLGGEAYEARWQAGRLLAPDEAVEEVSRLAARQLAGPAPVAGALPGGLTAREAEVIGLVAAGLTNGQVAERLYLSRRTVDAHLRRIYDKLDLPGRAELVAFAREQGIREG